MQSAKKVEKMSAAQAALAARIEKKKTERLRGITVQKGKSLFSKSEKQPNFPRRS